MAGIEERLSKLESILNKLFCCSGANQFTGPQGPPGPIGLQGPPGVDGSFIVQNLNWMGSFSSCVIYNQYDAVSFEGSSYFLNCESSEGFECETPLDNSCWVLLANAGATGPQGPTGQEGNDGSNSGRWNYQGVEMLGPIQNGAFSTNNENFAFSTSITINKKANTTADYTDWLTILTNLNYSIVPAYLQITKVGNNNIVALYEITGQSGFVGPSLNQSLGLTINYIGGQNTNFESGESYTISWVLNGLGTLANKTVGNLQALSMPGVKLNYDYNIVTSEAKNAFVYLPDTTQIGKEVVVFSTRVENEGFYILANSEATLDPINLTPTCTGFLATFGIEEVDRTIFAYPNANYKFTFLGNIAPGGKAFWNMEAMLNTYPTSGSQKNLLNANVILDNPIVDETIILLTAADLNTQYPDLGVGTQFFAPNQPGGPRLFIKGTTGWYSLSLNTVP